MPRRPRPSPSSKTQKQVKQIALAFCILRALNHEYCLCEEALKKEKNSKALLQKWRDKMPATYQSEMRKETTKEKRGIAGELQSRRPKYLEIKSNLPRESPEIHISSNWEQSKRILMKNVPIALSVLWGQIPAVLVSQIWRHNILKVWMTSLFFKGGHHLYATTVPGFNL